jgi:hypothetical protein
MAKPNSIIRVDRDGVEFFTIDRTGESGMSLTGLAHCCGVSRQAVTKHLAATKSDFKLDVGRVSVATSRGSFQVVVVKDTVCAEVISHYAQQGKPEAIRSLVGFAAIGVRTFIQSQTGWKPKSEVEQFVEVHVLREARIWEVVFDRQWVKAAEQCTGWKWSYQAMSRLINLTVYDQLPREVRQALDEYNPVMPDGHRLRKQHQHFSNESVEHVLRMQIDIARSLLLVSTSWDELKENSRRRFAGMSQLRLLP